jgi:uncharacterized damage-inducible protein DinB
MDTTLRASFDHDRWATLRLIDHLADLPPETLELDAPGTYGTIGATLVHIVDAAEGYLARLEDRLPPERPTEDEPPPSLAELRRRADEALTRLGVIALARDGSSRVTGRRRDSGEPFDLPAWLFLVQAVHHGTDHRAHICTVLGARELPTPDIDVWSYEDSLSGG